MSTHAAYHALRDHLTAFQPLRDWTRKQFDRSWTHLPTNRKITAIGLEAMPAIIYELDDAEFDQVVSGFESRDTSAFLLAFVWHEPDPERAYQQHCDLRDLIPRAVLHNDTLGDTVEEAYVQSIQSDRGGNHPVHSIEVKISYAIQVTP